MYLKNFLILIESTELQAMTLVLKNCTGWKWMDISSKVAIVGAGCIAYARTHLKPKLGQCTIK